MTASLFAADVDQRELRTDGDDGALDGLVCTENSDAACPEARASAPTPELLDLPRIRA